VAATGDSVADVSPETSTQVRRETAPQAKKKRAAGDVRSTGAPTGVAAALTLRGRLETLGDPEVSLSAVSPNENPYVCISRRL
jgi:hypothetical protein